MSAKPTINNDLHIYVVGSSKFQPRSLEETGATVTRRHTGLKMIQLEDIGWRKQVAKEVARVKPDLLVFVYEDLPTVQSCHQTPVRGPRSSSSQGAQK